MGVVTKPKTTTTTPSTPTTSSGQPTFIQADASSQLEPIKVGVEGSTTSRFQVSPITEERPGNLVLDASKGQIMASDGSRRHHHHEPGTSSPSPAGSTYTTASESGGPNTIESEPGNYLSASEDPHVIVAAASMPQVPPSVQMPPTYAAAAAAAVVAPVQPPVATTYNHQMSYCTSAEATMIPQHAHDTLARVSPVLFPHLFLVAPLLSE